MANKNSFYSDLDYYINKFKNIEIIDSKVNIISHDILTNSVYLFNHDINESINRIHYFFKLQLGYEVKIFFSIRNQKDIIPSYYAQFYRKIIKINTKWRSFREFLNSLKDSFSNNENNYNIFNNFLFFNYYNIINEKFGNKNIKLLLYEDIIFDPDYYFNQLSDFLEINLDSHKSIIKKFENKSSYIEASEYERKYIILYKSFSKFLKNKYIKKKIYRIFTRDKVILFKEDRELINKYYYKDNKSLNAVLNNRLNKYNYLS